MCLGCLIEFCPDGNFIDNKRVKATARLINAVYELHSCGGGCHIVTDDCNLNDENIDWCINHVKKDKGYNNVEKVVYLACLDALKILPLAERASALYFAERP